MLEQSHPITIAIDGFSACGKSTLAKSLAKAMHYIYIDSGAMYRAITWYCIQLGIKASELDNVERALSEIDLRFAIYNGQNCVLVDGKVLDLELRSLQVNEQVSYFAEIPFARRKLVRLQQDLGSEGAVVMDGRDIASVVFPDAELKLFVQADFEVRAKRRFLELSSQYPGKYSLDEVKENLALRDRIDSTRVDSPLHRTNDAIIIDTTFLKKEETLDLALKYAKRKVLDFNQIE